MDNSPELRIGAAYIRVSTDDQLEYSPESQLEKIREYAKTHDIIVPDEYVFMEEEGRSGRSTKKRVEFNRMIGTAKTKPRPFDVLLLWKFSRFARSREDSILYKSMLRRDLGIEVVSVSEPIGEDKMSILIEAIIEAMDEYYSINLAEEVRRGMTQRARAGRPNTYAPIGYRMQDGAYVPDPDTAPIVRKIYEDYAAGHGLLQISHELTALGVRTRFGNPIDNRGVKYILRNPTYLGKVRWTPTGRTRRVWDNPDTLLVDSGHEPLVSQALYDRVQAMLDDSERRHQPHSREDGAPFALKGLVKCSCCGATLVRQRGAVTKRGGGPSLQCHNYARGRCPESHGILISKLTDAVLAQIAEDFRQLDFVVTSTDGQQVRSDNGAAVLARQIAREERKLERIREAYEAGVDTLEEYQQRKAAVEQRIAALRSSAPPADNPVSPASFAASHAADLEKVQDPAVDPVEQNKLLRSFVRQIVFDRKNNSFTIQYYT